MTDFRTKGTIIGPMGLTAVFGMGTGVTPSVWSPTKRQTEVFHSARRVIRLLVKLNWEPLLGPWIRQNL